MGQAIFRLLRNSLDDDNATLLREADNVGDADGEKAAMVAQHVQSQFSINTMSIAEDPESRRLGNLVAAYEELGLSDEASVRGSQGGHSP